MTPFRDPRVARKFDSYPTKVRRKLLRLRELIFATAARSNGVGAVAETLKWGEPAYVTAETRSGTTIRIDWKAAKANQYAMYFHCRTNLVASFRRRFAGTLRYESNRAIVFAIEDRIPTATLSACIKAALTYHLSTPVALPKP
jgi:hypothetical protein